MERGKSARRIATKCVAALGIRLANAQNTRKADAHRACERLTRSNATCAARYGSRNVYDQSPVANHSRSAVISFLGAQAASLSFSAACRKALRTPCAGLCNTPGVVDKLPTTAGSTLRSPESSLSILLKLRTTSR